MASSDPNNIQHRTLRRGIAALPGAMWRPVHVGLLLLKPVRFSLIMVVAGLAFLASDQGADTLRDFAERKAGTRHDAVQTVAFWVGAFLWAYGSWFWARVLSKIRLGDTLPDTSIVRTARIWIPRAIGAAAIFGLAIAFYCAAAPYSSALDGPGMMLKRYAAYSLVGGVVFILSVIFRRDYSPKLAPYVERLPGGAAFGRTLRSVKSTEQAKQEFGNREIREVLLEARWLLGASLSIAAAMFVLFSISPEWFGPRFGSTPILLLAAAGWIAAGSAADLFAMVYRFPVWIALFIAALLFSFVNDNHAVRTLDGPAPQEWSERQTVAQALESWKRYQQKRPPVGADGRYPLFLVAAEGGGIRAAYWTASVLGKIQDRNPCFADQLFAMSGVSGGSLGVAVFDALVVEDRGRSPDVNCNNPAPGKVGAAAEAILSEDFLAPTIAAMLYPDLFQRVFPFPIAHFDRARALETSWEKAWQQYAESNKFSGTTRLADAFDQLWRGPADRWTPALFLNSTIVETGKRLITSNLRLTPTEFSDAEDTHQFYVKRALPLSTAVHLSARFTYVSPAGTLVKDGKAHGRAVDGGYFENSGATTLLEILDNIELMQESGCKESSDCGFWSKVKPVVIHISNEPSDGRFRDASLAEDPDRWEPTFRPTPCCNEVWSPIRALLATRGARGGFARETIEWRVGSEQFLHFGLCANDTANIPLGWSLSESVRGAMKEQLRSNSPNTCPAFNNPSRLQGIASLLRK